MQPDRYNVRVYGIWINDLKQVLLTRERRGGYEMIKFPGGGLEFGEGLANGLRREWMEELKMEIKVKELFYINDFLQLSAFNPKDQLLSIYYMVHGSSKPETSPLGLPSGKDDAQTFEWFSLNQTDSAQLTFPVDRVVLEKLQERFC